MKLLVLLISLLLSAHTTKGNKAAEKANPNSAVKKGLPTKANAQAQSKSAIQNGDNIILNDNPCNAIEVRVGDVITGTLVGATADSGEVHPGTDNDGQDGWFGGDPVHNSVWYKVTAYELGIAMQPVGDALDCIDSQLAVYTITDCADYGTFEKVKANDDCDTELEDGFYCDAVRDDCEYPARILPFIDITCDDKRQEYYIQVDGWSGDSGPFQMEIEGRRTCSPGSSASNGLQNEENNDGDTFKTHPSNVRTDDVLALIIIATVCIVIAGAIAGVIFVFIMKHKNKSNQKETEVIATDTAQTAQDPISKTPNNEKQTNIEVIANDDGCHETQQSQNGDV